MTTPSPSPAQTDASGGLAVQAPAPTPTPPDGEAGNARLRAVGEVAGRWAAALVGAVAIFSVILLTRGANPLTTFQYAWENTLLNGLSVQEILIKMGPIALAALAVVVPAKAGLVNVGGEGQLLVGAVAAAGVALATDQSLPGGLVLVLMMVAAAVAGALWAGIAAALRVFVKVNEAVSTLLLNYVALDLLLFLIYQPWKDPNGSGQPATRPLADVAKMPVFTGSKVHVGLAIVVIAAIGVWAALRFTTWGFRLATVGGNPEAARRAGFPVTMLLLSGMLVGGALAGLGGMIHFAGVEYQLRPGILSQIGYTAFLASWLARHKPLPVLVASLVLSALIVAGDSFQIDSGLPAATVNILIGLLLIAVLGWTGTRTKSGA
ncbi:MAG: ABC transporter permease [Kineosporiaceae bacterium]